MAIINAYAAQIHNEYLKASLEDANRKLRLLKENNDTRRRDMRMARIHAKLQLISPNSLTMLETAYIIYYRNYRRQAKKLSMEIAKNKHFFLNNQRTINKSQQRKQNNETGK